MKAEIKVNELSHEDIVNIFSSALYGCNFLSVGFDQELWESVPHASEKTCIEDKVADLLLAGKNVYIYDDYAEGTTYGDLGEITNEDGYEIAVYTISLADVLVGCSKADGYRYADELLVLGTGDYYTANNLMQLIVFGEVIYG